MSSLLEKLEECARLISSDKVVDRKKQIEELPFILSNEAVLQALDKNGYRHGEFTWSCLFDSAKHCVMKEMEHMEKESQKGTAAYVSSRDRKKKACAGLIRLVISQANSRAEPKLKTNSIVNHLLVVMRSEFMWNLLSVEYSNILLKEVLAHRRIVRDIPRPALDEFILVYTDLYKTSKSVTHHDLIMQILAAIIQLAYFQTVLNESHLFAFFKDIVIKSRSSLNTSLSQQESLMFTCLTFCKATAVNCRLQLCYFGEIVFESLLSVWGGNISKKCKALLIDFFQLQMVCHHPKGASSETEGMVSCDSELWKRNLHGLYNLLIKELQHPAFRGRHSTKSLGLESDFLELLVDVFHAEIVFGGFKEEEACSSSTKRRRIEHGFVFLMDTIQTVGTDTDDVVAWLQLVGGSLRKYPEATATFQELASSIGLLHQLQTDCKRYVIMSPLLDCFRWVLGAYLRLRPTNDCDYAVKSWTKIYDLTVRTVSLNHCIDEGHSLLCALINSKVLNPGPELWCFLTPGLNSPSVASLKTLSAILTNSNTQRLSEKGRMYGGGDHFIIGHTNSEEIRLRLLDWLLPNYLEESSPSVFKRNDSWPIELHAQTLVALALGDHNNNNKSVSKPHSMFCEDSLEDIFLQATYDLTTSIRQNHIVSCDSKVDENFENADGDYVKYNVLDPAKNKLIEYLLRDCSVLLDPERIEGRDVVAISVHCCLVTKCVGHLVQTGALSPLDLIHMKICDILQKLMMGLSDLLHTFCTDEKNTLTKQQILTAVVSNLRKLYSWVGKADFRQTMSEFCREMTPMKLVDLFFDCLYGSVFPNCLATSTTKSKLNSSDSGDFDPDFNFADDTVDCNSIRSKQRSFTIYKYGDFFNTEDESDNCVFDWPMSDVERLQLNLASLLTVWCENPGNPLLSPLRPKAATSSSAAAFRGAIQNRILQPLLEEKFNVEAPFNVQLVFTIMMETVKPAHTLDLKCLNDLLTVLRRICKAHFKDGEMSLVCLELLSNVLPRLNEYYVGKNFEVGVDLGLRDHVLHLLSAFCACRSKGNCGPYTELAIVKALVALAKCDLRLYQQENLTATKLQYPTPILITSFMEPKNFPASFYSAKNVQLLLQNGRNINDFDIKVSNDVLRDVLKSISNAVVSTDGSLKQQDLQSNWTSSSIAALTQLTIGSPFCQQQALFAMSVHAKEVKSSVPIIRKAVKTIAASLGFGSAEEFMKSQVDCLLYRCFEKDCDLEQFIWKLTDSESLKEFYQKHYQSVVPLLFALRKWERFRESICEALDRTPADIVADCFPQIMTFVFPGYALGDNAGSLSCAPSKETAQYCHDLAEEILSNEGVNQQLSTRLDEIVISLIKCIHVSHVQHNASIVLPSSCPPSYELDTVRASLTYIMEACNEKNTSLVSVLCKTPDGIQKVLLSLQLHLKNSHQPHEAYNAVVGYKFFVLLVWKEFEGGLENTWAFVMHDVVTTLFHLLQRCDSHHKLHAVAWECCTLLRDIAESCVNTCLIEFSKLVPLYLSGLTAHCSSPTVDTALRDQAIAVIDFLVIEKGDMLSETVVHLEPFPDLPIFDSAREKYVALKYAKGPLTLKQEIEHFLRGLKLNEGHLRSEGLQFLRLQLVSRPAELKELIRELKNIRLADECSENVLYCLLVELVHLCCESAVKSEIVVEAACCLGELGPLPVSSVVLQPSKTCDVAFHAAFNLFCEDAIAQRNVLVFHKLWAYLSDSSVDVKVVISQVLKQTLLTKSGLTFGTKYKAKKTFPLFNYLHPFVSKTVACSSDVERMTDEEFSDVVDSVLVWSPEEARFDEYIVSLCCVLIRTGVHGCEILQHLHPVCKVKVNFCTELFPFLVHSILLSDKNDFFLEIITRQIDEFFAKFVKTNSTSSRESSLLVWPEKVSGPIYRDKQAIRVMLNTIQFLRLQKKRNPIPKRKGAAKVTPWDDSYRLDVDYLNVAQAAQFCAAHFLALLFVETWCEVKSRTLQGSQPSSSSLSLSSGSPISILCENCPDVTKIMQDLLLQIYRSIGDPDAVYGCGMAHLSDANVRLQYYEHERRWNRAVFAYDLSVQSADAAALMRTVEIPRTLQKLGLQHLSNIYLDYACKESQSAAIREFQSECAWKTTCWADLTAGSWLDVDDKSRFHELVHCNLVALRQGNQRRFRNLFIQVHGAVVTDLKHDDVESMAGLFHPLTCLYALNNLEDFCDWNRHDDRFVGNLLSKWAGRDAVVQRDYDVLDQVLSLRNAILQCLEAVNVQKNQDVMRALVNCEERQAELARKNGLLQLAETHISRLRRRSDSVVVHELRSAIGWKLEEAKIFWDGEEHDTAKSLLGIVIKELEGQSHGCSEMYAQALGLYGNWLIETHSENASSIMENYLEKSISLFEQRLSTMDAETIESLMNAYVTSARYADAHYKRIEDYFKSSDYESKQQMVVGSKVEAKRLRAGGNLDKDKQRSYVILMKQSEIDNKELESMRDDRLRFLLKAAQNYAKCLSIGSSQDIRVFRLVSLWFQNREVGDLNAIIKDLAAKVPSHKFLPLIYQLAARLGNNALHCSSFHKILFEIIERMTADHPHHTLLVMLALTNGTKDEEYLSSLKNKKATVHSKKAEETERAVAARDLLNRVRKRNHLGALVSDVEKVCDALIAFSYWLPPSAINTQPNRQMPTGDLAIDGNQPLAKLGFLNRVPPLTLRLPVDPTCRYDNIPGTDKYLRKFCFCGGINNPKRILCRATDGVVHTQLVKGNDDLRQDAVMQQVFQQVNELLSSNSETARRSLSIRTYKVVPLSQRSGILQWCENTMPVAEYLVDDPKGSKLGAHSRYYPSGNDSKNATVSECRNRMEKVALKSFQEKYETFLDICSKLKPVFRHFFLENFTDPPIWYERRMAYVRSVATTSIVGHILGLGDRHVNNILVDKRSAEFIHIDLGIAFEQGRILPTPEMVPFRLTRDVVDGMGITGTEGPFRRSCEKTMSVMRSSTEVVLTILEVFLYDPLYQWSLTPLQACKIQDARERTSTFAAAETAAVVFDANGGDANIDDERPATNMEEDINKIAERALYRLRQKLQGVEDGTALSVSGQVSHLIQEAMDPRNLCKMFRGWQAYL